MPEENAFFNDLPETGPKKEEETPAGDEHDSEDIKNLKIAKKKEDRKLEALKQLADTRRARKALEQEVEDEPAPVQKQDIPDVKKVVTDALKDKEEEGRKLRIQAEVRKIARSRQEAEQLYEIALTLPPSGDEALDVRFASDRYQVIKDRNRGFVAPSASSSMGGFSDLETRPVNELDGFSQEQIARLQAAGVTMEDIKKYKDQVRSGFDLSSLFTKRVVSK